MAACGRITSSRMEAIVLDAHGAELDSKRLLFAGENIPSRSVVSTSLAGSAALMLLPNMLLRLGGSAEMEIDALTFAVDGNETDGGVRQRAATVQLRRGHIVARVEQHGYNNASLTLRTQRAEMRSDAGALFEITEDSVATIATCVRGHLDMFPFGADHVSTIWPGETMRVDSAGSHHEPLTAAEREQSEKRCAQAEGVLLLAATAQFEARR